MKKFLSLSLLGAMILSTSGCIMQPEVSSQFIERLPQQCYNIASMHYDAFDRPYRVITSNCEYYSTPYIFGGASLGVGRGVLLLNNRDNQYRKSPVRKDTRKTKR
jgi:hypothetical protein